MTTVNWRRVVLGGLAAGLVMNASEAALHGGVLGGDAVALFESYDIPTTAEPWQMGLLIGMTFVLGVATVWLYAAIRPRYGAGPGTALRAGLAVFVLAHLWAGVYLAAGFAGLVTPRLAWIPVLWGLFEATAGALAGAWLYRE
jgi:hypothetical protein